jgi:hypothetical protein
MLQEFKIDIYLRRLWIATSWEEVKDKFTTYGEYEFKEMKGCGAVTYPRVKRKSSGTYGVLIVFNMYDDIGGSEIVMNIAHESVHAANAIFSELGVAYDLVYDEHAAYLVGWIAKCCWKVLQKICVK